MLKKTLTYTDYDGVERTEDFYFNLSEADLIDMEISMEDGFSSYIQSVIKSETLTDSVALFKKLVLETYGEKSDDGRRFIKSEELSANFRQTAAYSALFMELATNEGSATEFMKGILPAAMQADIKIEDAKKGTDIVTEALAQEKATKPDWKKSEEGPSDEELAAARKLLGLPEPGNGTPTV